MNRRAFLKLSALLAACPALNACAPAYARLAGEPRPAPLPPADDVAAFALLSRLTFGPRSEERARMAEIGPEAWIEEQLSPENIDDSGTDLQLRRFDTLQMAAHELHAWSDKLFEDNEDRSTVPQELAQATLLRQTYSRRQLYESLVDFWSDHFSLSVTKGDCYYLKTVDDRAVIRPHALGTFRELLWASAHSPAMLVYLDQASSDATHPNENYARELLELHTLGVGSGYTQTDVMELARALTGWTVKEHWWRGEFTFDPDKHAPGEKKILGRAIPEGGQTEAESVLEQLATDERTARFISGKLARRFLGSHPPNDLVTRAAQTFVKTNGDVRAVVRGLLFDGLRANAFTPKFKRPAHFALSALRQLNLPLTDFSSLATDYLARLGHVPFAWPTPDGYPDDDAAWQNNALPRWQWAQTLAEHEDTLPALEALWQQANAQKPAEQLSVLCRVLLGASLPTPTAQSLLTALAEAGEALPRVLVAGLLSAPAFQWR